MIDSSTAHESHSGGTPTLQKLPDVSGVNGVIGLPVLTKLLHLRGAGDILEAIKDPNAFSDTEVADGRMSGWWREKIMNM